MSTSFHLINDIARHNIYVDVVTHKYLLVITKNTDLHMNKTFIFLDNCNKNLIRMKICGRTKHLNSISYIYLSYLIEFYHLHGYEVLRSSVYCLLYIQKVIYLKFYGNIDSLSSFILWVLSKKFGAAIAAIHWLKLVEHPEVHHDFIKRKFLMRNKTLFFHWTFPKVHTPDKLLLFFFFLYLYIILTCTRLEG